MIISPVTPLQPTPYVYAPTPSKPQVTEPESNGVILQFTPAGTGKSGNYAPDGLPVEDSKRIKMEKARMKDENAPCQTCAERKYQDGSGDMGVSFKSATNVAPGSAASLVRSHEQEHVSRNRADANEKGLHAMSTVRIHTDICPECKKVYVSGGVTITQFKADPEKVVEAYAKHIGKPADMLKGA